MNCIGLRCRTLTLAISFAAPKKVLEMLEKKVFVVEHSGDVAGLFLCGIFPWGPGTLAREL